jgi:CheY-like chemotaxis protein
MTRVLLVDDDVNLREALEVAMTAAGHDVTVANNGLEALTTAVTASPQVIVTDVNMPVLEGPDMVRMLRAVPRLSRVPVILMSGIDTEAGIPVERHLRKPFDPTALLDSVSRVAAGAANASAEKKDRPYERYERYEGYERPAARQKKDRPRERFAARASVAVSRSQRSAGEDGVTKHIRRGLELVYEQEARMQMLRRLGSDMSLAEQLHEALVSSVAALSGLDRSGLVVPLLVSLHEAGTTGQWMESCLRECSRMHALGHFLERSKQVTLVSRARKRC